jgi:NAD(P)H dehydrogenase (quinone)
MRWKAVADAEDFPSRDPSERLHYALESGKAYSAGTQCPDVIAEQAKLEW